MITFTHFQPKILYYLIELAKQSSGTLFQAIQGLFQMTNFPSVQQNQVVALYTLPPYDNHEGMHS